MTKKLRVVNLTRKREEKQRKIDRINKEKQEILNDLNKKLNLFY